MGENFQIEVYQTDNGKLPYMEWENGLSSKDRAIVTTRLVRIRQGNLGDSKKIQGEKSLFEFRIDFGPGYRIYYGVIHQTIILLLCGGNKKTQRKDIQKAKGFWLNYLNSQKEG